MSAISFLIIERKLFILGFIQPCLRQDTVDDTSSTGTNSCGRPHGGKGGKEATDDTDGQNELTRVFLSSIELPDHAPSLLPQGYGGALERIYHGGAVVRPVDNRNPNKMCFWIPPAFVIVRPCKNMNGQSSSNSRWHCGSCVFPKKSDSPSPVQPGVLILSALHFDFPSSAAFNTRDCRSGIDCPLSYFHPPS